MNNYSKEYAGYKYKIAEKKKLEGEIMRLDINSTEEIEFKRNEILLMYKTNGKFSV